MRTRSWSGEIDGRESSAGSNPASPNTCRVEDDFAFEPTWSGEVAARGTDVGVDVVPPKDDFVDLCEGGVFRWVDGEADGEVVLAPNSATP